MEKIVYKIGDFEGPLDLILHLIRRNKLNIQDIQISELLEQYMIHIESMQKENMQISSEFLEMASRLVYIKTVSLLPKKEEEIKLKKELSDQIMKYEECKKLSEMLSASANFDLFSRDPLRTEYDPVYTKKHDPRELLKAYLKIIPKNINKKDSDIKLDYIVSKKNVSVYSKVIYILRKLKSGESYSYEKLFFPNMEKSSMVAVFLAVLELIKVKRVTLKECDGNINLSLNRKRS